MKTHEKTIVLHTYPDMYEAAIMQELLNESGIDSFLNDENVMGIDPVGGTVDFASDVPAGATLSFMKTDVESSRLAAQRAFQGAKSQLGGESPGAALFFDCVATRLRMGGDFKQELTTLSDALEGASFAGYNTYGQIARAEGQFNGFHNCTAVVCLIPR